MSSSNQPTRSWNVSADCDRFSRLFVGDVVRLDSLLARIICKLSNGLLMVSWITRPPDRVYQQNELRLHDRC